MLRFRVPGSEFRVRAGSGSGFGVPGSGFGVPGSGFEVPGSVGVGFRVRDSGFGFSDPDSRFGVHCRAVDLLRVGRLGAGRSARRQADRPVRGRRARRISEIQTGSQHCQRDQRAVDQPPGTRPGLCRRRTLLPRASGPGYVRSRRRNDGGTTQPDSSPCGRRRHPRPHRAQPDVVGDAANLVQLRQTPGMELHQRRDRCTAFTAERTDAPLPPQSGRSQTFNYGGGARWFSKKHIAFSVDFRFYAIAAQEKTATRPAFSRMTLTAISVGAAFK